MKLAGRVLATVIILGLPIYYWRFTVMGLPTNLTELASLLLLILTIATLISERRRPVFPLWLPTSLLIGALLLGTWGAPDRQVALGIVKGWFIIPAVFYWAVVQLFDRQHYRWLVGALVVGSLGVAAYALLQQAGLIGLLGYQQVGGNLQQYLDQHRALAFFESPNYLAMFLVPTAALTFWLGRGQYRWLGLAVAAGLTLVVVLTGSRSGLIALALGTLIIALIRIERLSIRFGVSLLTVLVIAGVLFLLPRSAGIDNERLYIWREAWSYYRLHPVWGIGPGAFQSYFQQYGSRDPAIYRAVLPYALHPHNLYLTLLLSGGPLALASFGWIVVELGRRATRVIRGDRYLRALLAGGLVILIQGLFDTTYFKNDLALIFWLLAAGIILLTENSDSEATDERV